MIIQNNIKCEGSWNNISRICFITILPLVFEISQQRLILTQKIKNFETQKRKAKMIYTCLYSDHE